MTTDDLTFRFIMIIYRRLEYEGQYSDVETLISQKNSQPK